MPARLTPEEAAALGVSTLHERMENGELRFRLRFADGSSYIRTEASNRSGWQASHLHRAVQELSVVQRGAMLVVEDRDGTLEYHVVRAGEFYLCPLNVPHNSYLSPECIAHTVKFGDGLPAGDWVPCPELDPICRALEPERLFDT